MWDKFEEGRSRRSRLIENKKVSQTERPTCAKQYAYTFLTVAKLGNNKSVVVIAKPREKHVSLYLKEET